MAESVLDHLQLCMEEPLAKKARYVEKEPCSTGTCLTVTTGIIREYQKMWWDKRRRKFKGGCGSIRVENGNQWEAVLINKSSYDTSFDGKEGDEVEFLKMHEGKAKRHAPGRGS